MKSFKVIVLGLLLLACPSMWADNVYDIYPVPQSQASADGQASFSETVSVVCGKSIDEATQNRALQVLSEHGLKGVIAKKASKKQSVLYLGVNGDKSAADKLATRLGLSRELFGKAKYDRHILAMRSLPGNGLAEVVILGENTDAAFCGLASLEQMLDRGNMALPCVTIYDWADVKNRGVIEGYYGVPYSQKVTEDLFRFMARYKLNTYMYGAKSDPYHSQYWDRPYPTTLTPEQEHIGMMTQDMLRSVVSVAHDCKVNFIWAIHPGTNFFDTKNDDVLDRIMQKFGSMYDLGVRQFGVFVDDCGVPDDTASLNLGARRLTRLQQMVDSRWNQPGTAPADTVKPLNYVPQLYAYSWVSRQKGERFFNSLSSTPSKTVIYITGAAVWTVPNNKDLELVNDWLGREVGWWWNYPCNDNDMDKLFVSDMWTNFADEKHIDSNARLVNGLGVKTLICNPMQQGAASKIALFSMGDYAWNNATFDAEKSYKAAIPAVVGNEYVDAFRTLAPYLRHYDYDSPWPTLSQMQKLSAACETIEQMAQSENESQRLFFADIRPWVIKVHDMANAAATLLREDATDAEIQQAKAMVQAMDTNEKYSVEVLNGMGNDIRLSTVQANPAHRVLLPMLKKLAATR